MGMTSAMPLRRQALLVAHGCFIWVDERFLMEMAVDDVDFLQSHCAGPDRNGLCCWVLLSGVASGAGSSRAAFGRNLEQHQGRHLQKPPDPRWLGAGDPRCAAAR